MPSCVSTLCMDFTLKAFPEMESVMNLIVTPLEKLTRSSFETSIIKNSRLATITCTSQEEPSNVFVLIRIYDKAFETENVLMAVTVECSRAFEDFVTMSDETNVEEVFKNTFEMAFGEAAVRVQFFPPLKRFYKDPPYLRSSDDRLLEYAFKEVCYSEESPYQNIVIADTLDFGKLLILDGMANLAESDTISYTHSLMALPLGFENKYKDSNILILGGGDGGLMKELLELKAPPAFVTMIDIDEMVMDAVLTHMPSVCGSYLQKESRSGSRHNILVGDAIAFMKDKLTEGVEYDFIFGDLTDTPVSSGQRDASLWNFLKEILELGLRLVKSETGYLMTHCNGINVSQTLESYEEILRKIHNGKCTFSSYKHFVPSFMETWVYYQIQRHE